MSQQTPEKDATPSKLKPPSRARARRVVFHVLRRSRSVLRFVKPRSAYEKRKAALKAYLQSRRNLLEEWAEYKEDPGKAEISNTPIKSANGDIENDCMVLQCTSTRLGRERIEQILLDIYGVADVGEDFGQQYGILNCLYFD